MKKINILVISCLVGVLGLYAQNDTITRVVEVEREYQPAIEGSGKLDIQPQVISVPTEEQTTQFSTYAEPLQQISPAESTNLGYAPTNFIMPSVLDGLLRGAIGHSATLFDFNYTMTEKKNLSLNINAHHLGQWGKKTLSHSSLGMDISSIFDNADVYFGINAENIFFSRYGKYFSYTDLVKMKGEFDVKHYSDFEKEDKTSQWEIDTKIGVRSVPNADFLYKAQIGYEGFVMQANTMEHIVNTQGMFEWQQEVHHVGAELHIENHIYSFKREEFENFYDRNPELFVNRSLDSTAYHAIKLEPYYAYNGTRFNIHAGVNLDFCVGRGKVFLPSPNVTFEAKITPDWLALYGGAIGKYATSSVKEHFRYMRYVHAENEVTSRYNRTYTPVDAFLGFKIRPHADLLIDIHAEYAYTKYDVFFKPDVINKGYFNLVSSPYHKWQVGARLHYHYQDIIFVSFDGYYNIWKMQDYKEYDLPNNHILDRPTWGINARIDGKIDSKWTLYADTYFSGGKYGLDYEGEAVKFKTVIDLNLGVQYNFNKWLSAYLQLNNLLNRKHDIVYGYQTQGINFLAGVSYAF